MPKQTIPDEHHLYQTYDQQEESVRVQGHYEQNPQFYYDFTGGEWNVYSGLIWPNATTTLTEAQGAKLDLLAHEMNLKPGMRIMDVGCGWGGPLVYLCKKYSVSGVGITVTPSQVTAAQARAAHHGVDAQFVLSHWENYNDEQGFDAIYSDEASVHFRNLGEFFARCWQWLRPGGRVVNKELHLTHEYFTNFDRAADHVHAIFGFSGHYHLLAEELQLLNDNNLQLVRVQTIDMQPHYYRTLEHWSANMFNHHAELSALASETVYQDFRKYLKITRRMFASGIFTLEVLTSQKFEPSKAP